MWGWIGLGRTKSPLRKFFAMVRCTEDHQTIRRSFHVNSLVNIVKGPTDPRVEFCFNTRVTSFGHIASSYTKLDQISSSESHSWILLFYEAGWNLTIAFYSRMRSLTTDVVDYDYLTWPKSFQVLFLYSFIFWQDWDQRSPGDCVWDYAISLITRLLLRLESSCEAKKGAFISMFRTFWPHGWSCWTSSPSSWISFLCVWASP